MRRRGLGLELAALGFITRQEHMLISRSIIATGHNRTMSPESVSSLFPQRPIRPLPKRRLRERLSPDVADSIEYPPANQNSSPLFYYPSIPRDEVPSRSGGLNGMGRSSLGYEISPKVHAGNGESDEEDMALNSSKIVRRSQPDILNRASALPPKLEQSKHSNPQPPPSTASSADGYESFENTNNKKKRKIPTAGDSALSGTHSLADIGSMSISAATSPSNEHSELGGSASPSYYGAGNFVTNNQGISGPGRGRFGRSRNGRSPLGTLSDAPNSWVGRGPKYRPPQWATSSESFTAPVHDAVLRCVFCCCCKELAVCQRRYMQALAGSCTSCGTVL